MEGYIAFRHYNISDMFRLNIDDVLIGEIPEPVEEAEWIYVDGIEDVNSLITGLDPATTYEVQVQAVNEYGESPRSSPKLWVMAIYYNLMGRRWIPLTCPLVSTSTTARRCW